MPPNFFFGGGGNPAVGAPFPFLPAGAFGGPGGAPMVMHFTFDGDGANGGGGAGGGANANNPIAHALQQALQQAMGGGGALGGQQLDPNMMHQLFAQMQRRSTPAAASAIAALKEVPITADDAAAHKQCHICMEEFAVGEAGVLQLPCAHRYHKACISPWLTNEANTCPMCRAPLEAARPGAPSAATEGAAAPAGAAAAGAGAGGAQGSLVCEDDCVCG